MLRNLLLALASLALVLGVLEVWRCWNPPPGAQTDDEYAFREHSALFRFDSNRTSRALGRRDELARITSPDVFGEEGLA